MQSQNQTAISPPGQDFFKQYGGSAPENYQRFFVPSIGAPFAAYLMDAAGLRPGERVLDVACGTGVVTRLAKERVGAGTAAGLDLNPCMLEVARSVTPADMAIAWHEANAENMPLPNEAFDVVLCQLGLQFVRDKVAALREIHRVLVPGGRFVFNVVGPTPPLFAVMAQGLARHINPEVGGFMNVVFSLHDADELRKLLSDASFRDIRVESHSSTLQLPGPTEFLWQYIRSTPLSAAVAKASDESRTALERDVTAEWLPFVKNGNLMCRLDIVVGTALK